MGTFSSDRPQPVGRPQLNVTYQLAGKNAGLVCLCLDTMPQPLERLLQSLRAIRSLPSGTSITRPHRYASL